MNDTLHTSKRYFHTERELRAGYALERLKDQAPAARVASNDFIAGTDSTQTFAGVRWMREALLALCTLAVLWV